MPPDIRSAHLFSELNDDQLQRVLDASHMHDLSDGQPLFMAGDPARRFFLVLGGQIKLFRLSAEGNEKIIEIIRPGNTFAEALMFLDAPAYPVNATALGPCRLMSFDTNSFLGLLRGSVDTCFRVMGVMSQRLRGLIKEIDDLTLQSATSRVSAMLLQHLRQGGDLAFTLSAPKGVLASRLSVKPETFSRILHDLSDRGVLRVKGSRIEVLNADELQRQARLETSVGLESGAPVGSPCPMTSPNTVN